jgi:signal transduction histidine kinase/PAS domain-containing protein
MNQKLQNIDPLILFVIAAVMAVFALVFIISWSAQRRRAAGALAEVERLQAVAIKGKEILAAAPDGLFLWDHVLGGITVSRRLAVLLNLEAGTHSRFDDIRTRFAGDSLKALERGCSALRANGKPFDLLLKSQDRLIQAIGQRAETEKGESLADLVWMRDVSALASGEAIVSPEAKATGYDDRHLTALLDAMPVPIWLRDSKLNLAFANIASTDIAEMSSDLAKRAKEISAPASERRLIDVDGSATLMDITEIPLASIGGGTLGYAIEQSTETREWKDTPEQSKAEQTTADAVSTPVPNHAGVLDELSTAIAIFAKDTRLEYFNAAYATLWGLEADWLLGGPNMSELLEKQRDDRSLPEVTDFKVFKDEQIAHFRALREPVSELMHLPDGRSLRHRVSPYGDGGLAHTFEDQSERLDLQRSYKELGAVQMETLDNLHEGVAVFGSDGLLKLYNPVYARLWELHTGDLDTHPHVSDVLDKSRHLIPSPEDTDAWTDESWNTHRSLVSARLLSRAQSEGQLHLKSGTVIEYANVPLPDGAVLLSYVDVTDSARIEQALRERAKALEDANLMKSEFIADVAREIRTPLNTVIGFADMLGQEYFGQLNPRQDEYARGISGTSKNLMGVVGDILDLASMDAGHLDLELDSVDIHGLLVSALHLIEDRAKRKDIKLTFECPPEIGWVIADGERLKQIVYKLLANAVAFTPPHGSVTLKGARSKSEVELTISDTGVGIATPDKERIFEPFDTGAGNTSPVASDTGEKNQGVGLGLTIVKRLIERHGGTVEVRSQLGRGTTIICRLPGDIPDDQIGAAISKLQIDQFPEPGENKSKKP